MVKHTEVVDKNTPPPVYGGRLGGGPHTARNKCTQKRAENLRANLTEAEQALWKILRRDQLGIRFRRQHPIGPYIVDFACLTHLLIIEIDGGKHAEKIAYDTQRTHFLEKAGFCVLRFWNNEVLQNPEGVYSVIMEILQQSPTPALPRKQGREKCAPLQRKSKKVMP
jgi:very-short-patch-repair endonuclease